MAWPPSLQLHPPHPPPHCWQLGVSVPRGENPAMYTLSVWVCYLSAGFKVPAHTKGYGRRMKGSELCVVRIVALPSAGVLTHAADFASSFLTSHFTSIMFHNEDAVLLPLSLCRESALRNSGPSSSSWTTWRILPSRCKCTTSPIAQLVKVESY